MTPPLPVEIYYVIMDLLANESNLGDDLDDRISPFHDEISAFPVGRSCLATSCALVSKVLHDIVMPLVWQHLVIRRSKDLVLLHKLSKSGLRRPTKNPLPSYCQRIDFKIWRNRHTGLAQDLLSSMRSLRTLTLNNHLANATMWPTPSRHSFIASITSSCPRLTRLQFLSTTEVPSLRQIEHISVALEHLRTFQTVCLRSDRHHQDPETDSGSATSATLPHAATELVPKFPSLKTLCVGTGYFYIGVSGAENAVALIDRLRLDKDFAPNLLHLDAYLPFAQLEDTVQHLKDRLRSNVCHLPRRGITASFNSYHHLYRLVLVVHLPRSALTVPTTVPCLQVLEFITRRGPSVYYTADQGQFDKWMLEVMSDLLNSLLTSRFPALAKVVLWRRVEVPGNQGIIDQLAEDFEQQFNILNVALETKTIGGPVNCTGILSFLY
ncbi:hypothetical protein NMY22_g8768 [Coprinellus aureogranulatus]|nr:hypothetical protein NMY22_g8768 [Coprinellus aureogranulatus]